MASGSCHRRATARQWQHRPQHQWTSRSLVASFGTQQGYSTCRHFSFAAEFSGENGRGRHLLTCGAQRQGRNVSLRSAIHSTRRPFSPVAAFSLGRFPKNHAPQRFSSCAKLAAKETRFRSSEDEESGLTSPAANQQQQQQRNQRQQRRRLEKKDKEMNQKINLSIRQETASRNPRDRSATTTATASSPFPTMPSSVFLSLASTQLELLANSLLLPNDDGVSSSKVKSIALYLPQENVHSGQLEFVPTIVYPPPTSERVFIASDAQSGTSPSIPKTLTKLPGFAHAQTLIPTYPFFASSAGSSSQRGPASAGTVEEVLCDLSSGETQSASALSVPLFFGSRTVAVLLVWPVSHPTKESGSFWTEGDSEQIRRVADSLALALSMEVERMATVETKSQLRASLADNLHQVKNPLQAMRTFAKLLQRQLDASDANTSTATATEKEEDDLTGSVDDGARSTTTRRRPSSAAAGGDSPSTRELLQALADNLLVQSDRLADLMLPMDSLVDDLGSDLEDYSLYSSAQQGEEDYYNYARQLGFYLPVPRPSGIPLGPAEDEMAAAQASLVFSDGDANGGIADNDTQTFLPPPELIETWMEIQEFAPGGEEVDLFLEDFGDDSYMEDTVQEFAPGSGDARYVWPMPTSSTSSEPALQMVFVADVLQPILTAAEMIAVDSGIDLRVLGGGDDDEEGDSDDLPGVLANPKLLQEAVSNVLDNAMKYVVFQRSDDDDNETMDHNPRNPHPKIRVTLAPLSTVGGDKDDVHGVAIWIEDNGPGIPLEDRDLVFERGYRGADSKGVVSGNGIGLDISRSLMQQMGGSLELVDMGPSRLCKPSSDGGEGNQGTVMKLTLYRPDSA